MKPNKKPWGDEIERFYLTHSPEVEKREFMQWAPGTYMYIFSPTSQNLRYLSNRLAGDTILRKGITFVLRRAESLPQLIKYLPMVDRCAVRVDPNQRFDMAILGSRTKLLKWDSEVVITLSNGHPHLVRKEIEIRQDLPASIPVPSLVDADTEFPYFEEKLIDGTTLKGPMEDWSYYREAFRHLGKVYRHFPSRSIQIQDVLADMEKKLRRQNLLQDPVIHGAVELMNHQELPNALRRGFVHGDVYRGNVMRHHEDVVLLDWAESGFDRYQFGDLIHPVIKEYGITGDPDPLQEIYSNRGKGGEILTDYSRILGEKVWNSEDPFPGGLLLHPLLMLAEERYQRDYSETVYYQSILSILDLDIHNSEEAN